MKQRLFEITGERTSIYPITSKLIKDEWELLRREQIIPWVFFGSEKEFKSKDFYGKDIRYSGIAFEGSPSHVFWGGYIEPFLESISYKVIDETINICKEKEENVKGPLEEVGKLLEILIINSYELMVDIDKRLRGKGFPQNIESRDVSGKIAKMKQFVDDRVESEISLWKQKSGLNEIYHKHPFWFWLVGIVIAIIGILAI